MSANQSPGGANAFCLAIVSTLLFSLGTIAKYPENMPGEFVVKIKEGVSWDLNSLEQLAVRLGGKLKSNISEHRLIVLDRTKIESVESAIEQISKNPKVQYAEPNFIYRAERTPDDPMFGNLWGLKNVGQIDSSGSVGQSGVDIDVEGAWNITTGSSKNIIAVIDTGIDYTHVDLKENMWINEVEASGKKGIDDDNNGVIDDIYGARFTEPIPSGDPMDDHGHGSHCAGTIGAKGNDHQGIVGVNWNAKIMAVKFLTAEGGGTLENAIRAIDYATKMGAKIMSNSWGGGGYSEALKQAIVGANNAGALFVAAAGNDSSSNDTGDHYPSNYEVPNVLSVAAIDNKGLLASFSNYGKKVHVAAPGVNIYSSIPGNKYDSWSGTSMATPHVTGVAALILANEPNLTNAEVKERIVSTVKPMSGLHNKVKSGGLVNAYFAVSNTVAPPDPNDPANWQSQQVAISSAHPYKANTKQEFEIQVNGASEIALFFKRFETEREFDKVSIYDQAGNEVGKLSGLNDETFTARISGQKAKVVFESDSSVEKYGFDITAVSYR